jgi:hypothetical protein
VQATLDLVAPAGVDPNAVPGMIELTDANNTKHVVDVQRGSDLTHVIVTITSVSPKQ